MSTPICFTLFGCGTFTSTTTSVAPPTRVNGLLATVLSCHRLDFLYIYIYIYKYTLEDCGERRVCKSIFEELLADRENWDSRAPENCQRETENTEHTVLRRQRQHNPKKDTRSFVFFPICSGNRLSFPANEDEDVSTI